MNYKEEPKKGFKFSLCNLISFQHFHTYSFNSPGICNLASSVVKLEECVGFSLTNACFHLNQSNKTLPSTSQLHYKNVIVVIFPLKSNSQAHCRVSDNNLSADLHLTNLISGCFPGQNSVQEQTDSAGNLTICALCHH